ncbi:unnamed protein product [Alopecurus aequalis]
MAKSVHVPLLLLLAIAVSLHTAHRVSAAGRPLFAGAAKASARLDAWIKNNAKAMEKAKLHEKINDFSDFVEAMIDEAKSRSSTELRYVPVTSITVDGRSTIAGGGAVLLVGAYPYPFLTKVAYGLLKKKLPVGWSEVGALHQLCYVGELPDKIPEITVVFNVNGAKKTVSQFWHQKNDGSACLGILS